MNSVERIHTALKLILLTALLLVPLAALHAVELKLGGVFSNHMVVQRDRPVSVWGWADSGEQINVQFAGQQRNTLAGSDGRWSVRFDRMAASAHPRTILVRSGRPGRMVEIADVLVGDVWLAAGQSNMGMTVAKSDVGDSLTNHPVPPNIRFSDGGSWRRITMAEVPKLSAVAWVFAREIAQSKKVPVGIIVCARGGTRIEAWMPRSALMQTEAGRSFAALAALPEVIAAAEADARAFVPYTQTKLYTWRMGRALPAALYSQFIAPLERFSLCGVIWYHGESNANRMEDATAYAAHLRCLINAWRDQFDQPLLPFIIVQLPRYEPPAAEGGIDPWIQLRSSQQEAVKSDTAATLVDAYDLGDPTDIHPRRKNELGQRIAAHALTHIYQP